MKKILIVVSVLLLIICFTSCGAGDVGSADYMANKQSSEKAQSDTAVQNEPEPKWDADFNGLIQCFEWKGYIKSDSRTQTIASVVGANEGYRFVSNANGVSFNLELYYYDSSDPLENKEQYVNQINENGYFSILDTNVQAVISDNGKYMMIYGDTSNNEKNIQVKQEIYNTLKNFR